MKVLVYLHNFSLPISLAIDILHTDTITITKVLANMYYSRLMDICSYVPPGYCKTLYVRVPLFRELNITAKLKGVNIDTAPTLIGITHVLKLCGLNSPK